MGNEWGNCTEFQIYIQQLRFVPHWLTHTQTHSQADVHQLYYKLRQLSCEIVSAKPVWNRQMGNTELIRGKVEAN